MGFSKFSNQFELNAFSDFVYEIHCINLLVALRKSLYKICVLGLLKHKNDTLRYKKNLLCLISLRSFLQRIFSNKIPNI